MKRLIYITITYILLAAVSHAKSWFETHPNYFATAAINDADSITFDEYFTGGTIALRSPAISKGDTIWTLFCLVFTLMISKNMILTLNPDFMISIPTKNYLAPKQPHSIQYNRKPLHKNSAASIQKISCSET